MYILRFFTTALEEAVQWVGRRTSLISPNQNNLNENCQLGAKFAPRLSTQGAKTATKSQVLFCPAASLAIPTPITSEVEKVRKGLHPLSTGAIACSAFPLMLCALNSLEKMTIACSVAGAFLYPICGCQSRRSKES